MAADLASTIAAVRHDGRQRMATCPAHDDSTASVSVGLADNGGVLLRCMADCDTKVVLDRAGLTWQDIMPVTTSSKPRRRIVAEYDYVDESGQTLYQAVRYEPKSFSQRGPNGKNMQGVARYVLYNLPHLARYKSDLFIVEGEKDADRLGQLALNTTTNIGGAGKWRDEYTQQLVAAGVTTVIVLPDNDDPGRAHARQVAASCHAAGLTVRIVELPNLPPKGDVSDWIISGPNRRAELLSLAATTPTYAPPSSTTTTTSMDISAMLATVKAFIALYVHMTPAQATTLALWVAHTHAIVAFEATPYLQITSATPEAGKTRLLEVLALLVRDPWFTGRTSAAVLVRKIDAEAPTMLLDESDAAFNGEKDYAEALRGILNLGYRRTGKASLCVGQGANITFRDFSVFSAKAIAGIGKLPDTVASRAIRIELKRRTKDEPVAKFRDRYAREAAKPIVSALETWSAGAIDVLRDARPTMPPGLRDRAEDTWEPLFAIADLAGGTWPDDARQAARELSGGVVVESDISTELLKDCRDVFEGETFVRTKTLVERLIALDDRPWAAFGRHEKPITATKLAALLKKFSIVPKSTGDARGFYRDRFDDAWTRYLPSNPSTRQNPNENGPESAFSTRQEDVATDGLKSEKTPTNTGLLDGLTGSPPDPGDLESDDHDDEVDDGIRL